MIVQNDFVGALALGIPVLLILAAAEAWARLARPDPEWTRKLVHAGGGIACLFIPFLLRSPWTVLILAVGLSALFALGGRFGFLKSLHGVSRATLGSEYYPLSIFLVFVLAQGRPWLYVSSVLALAVADAMAALVGSRYGSVRYEVEENQKSLEGSLVFLAVTFLAIHLPLLLMTDYPRADCVLSALLVATLVTGFEAISLRGTDNLFVPLGTFLLLDRTLGDPLNEVIARTLAIPVLCVPIGLAVWNSRSFNVGAALVFVLFVYATWILGSFWWAFPTLVGFFIYTLLWSLRARGGAKQIPVRVRTLTRALLPLLLILAIADATSQPLQFYGPYLASAATVFSFSVWNRYSVNRTMSGSVRWLGAGLACLVAWALTVALPWAFMRRAELGSVAAVLAVCLVLSVVNEWFMRRRPPFPEPQWPASAFLMTLLAGAATLALQRLHVIASWTAA